ncbi:APO protein 1, chloroplastic isoform X1 [Musa acuminata AAA Group]|uniref:APO protein 1, chloroplastic isoform X1 n=2 Tax=Musa acuminata AAA Group TaxID=214697 RepID=UPI0031D40BA0
MAVMLGIAIVPRPSKCLFVHPPLSSNSDWTPPATPFLLRPSNPSFSSSSFPISVARRFDASPKTVSGSRTWQPRPHPDANRELYHLSDKKMYKRHKQNVDLPSILPKNKKKPYPIPIQKMQRAARRDKRLAEMGIEKPLEPPKNGLLVPELIPVAYEVLDHWKVLIKGLSQLMNVVTVYGCSKCPEVHVGPVGHQIQDCHGTGSEQRRSYHSWVKGSINDVLIPIESYHLFDPFGRRIKHETRFDYDRIPAVVELCIQAGVDFPEYPSRRRTSPIRMLGKKVIDRGGYVEEPKPHLSENCMSLLAELDTYGAQFEQPPLSASDTRRLAERTLKAYSSVRCGVRQLMKKYSVKACGYCSEVHVGPWGHNAKLCGAFKHQWRDGKHGWQDAILDEVIPQNYVWHLRDPHGPPLQTALRRYHGKAPAVVEVCVQAGAEIPESYKPMMRLDIIIPDTEEARLVA